MSSEVAEIVSGITDVLRHTSLEATIENDSSTITMLALYLERNQSAAARNELLSSLLELVEGEGAEERKLALFQESSLTFIPLIAPLTRSPETASVSERLIALACQSARPREAVLALGEVLEGLEDQIETFDVSDDEDGFEEEEEEDERDRLNGIIEELRVIIDGVAVVISRLPKKRSTPTILRFQNTLGSLLSSLSQHTSNTSSRALLTAIAELVTATTRWSKQCEDDGGEQMSMLSNVLFVSVTLLGPRVGAAMLERWFTRAFPRYAKGETEAEISARGGRQVLELCVTTAQTIGMTTASLIHTLTHPCSINPHSSLAALLLLSARICSDTTSVISEISSTSLLEDSTPVLSAALGGSAVDAGLVWIWEILHTLPEQEVDHEVASMLIEILVPLTAMHPSTQARLALFKLLSRVCSVVSSPLDEILLLRQLVEPENPFDEIRLAGVSIIREKLSGDDQSRLLTPVLLSNIGVCCFDLPPGPEPTLELTLPELLETMWPAWWSECLALLWLLVTVDERNLSGVWEPGFLKELDEKWLAPQRSRIVDLEREREADEELRARPDVEFTLQRWGSALKRVEEVLQRLQSK